jgi:CheY-like chemotaxis protein
MHVFTLLIVSDSTWSDDLKKTLFAREGRRIVTAATLAEAQQKARFAPPDLVVARKHLADGSADELCRWFRQNTDLGTTRIVVMLDADSAAEAKSSHDAGADQVIVKPESPEALTPLIAQIIDAPLRKEIRVPVEVRVEGETSRGIMQGLTRNLSPGGAMLEVSSAQLEKGDVLYIRLHPHGVTVPIVAKAEVMRVQVQPLVTGIGIRFLRFDRDGKERLEQFLEARQSL